MGEKHEIERVEEVEAMPIISAAPEVDVQITTAKRYPRSVKRFLDEAQTMATIDDSTAASMAYALPRSGKTIEGPSVRLAEIMAGAWGNLRAETRILETDAKHITAEAMCWDLEKNVAIRTQVKRRITDKYGKRYNDDMIVVTGNAASAIAFRNAVFKIIPGSYVSKILAAARKVAIGDAKNLSITRDEAFAWFKRFGITDERILATLGKPSIEDVDIDDVHKLRGFSTAIRDEGADVQDIFPPIETDEDKDRKAKLKANLAKGRKVNGDDAPPKDPPATATAASDDAESYGDGKDTPPLTIIDQDNDEIDPVTGEVLNAGDGQAESQADDDACPTCEGSGKSATSGRSCLSCGGTGRDMRPKHKSSDDDAPLFNDDAPAAKPKAAKKSKKSKKSAESNNAPTATDDDAAKKRQTLVSSYIDYCISLGVESGNVGKMTNAMLEAKVAEMKAQSEGGE